MRALERRDLPLQPVGALVAEADADVVAGILGCPACGGTGNKGRIACHEVMRLNDPIKEAILANLPTMKLKKVAMANGMRSLRQSALNKMVQGIVNAVEVTAVTAADSDDDAADKTPAA